MSRIYTGHSADRPPDWRKPNIEFAERLKRFMAHAKECEQCELNPLERCAAGRDLLGKKWNER